MNLNPIKNRLVCITIVIFVSLLVHTIWTYGSKFNLIIAHILDQKYYPPPFFSVFVIILTSLTMAYFTEKYHLKRLLLPTSIVVTCWFTLMIVIGQTLNYGVLFIPGTITIVLTGILIQLKNVIVADTILSKKLSALTKSGHSLERVQTDVRVENCLKLVETILPQSETVVFRFDDNGKLSPIGRTKTENASSSSVMRQNNWSEVLQLCENVLKSKKSIVKIDSDETKQARVAVPLIDDNNLVGVLFVRINKNFEPEDQTLLESFSEQLARNFHRQEVHKKLATSDSWIGSLSTHAIKTRTENISLIRGLMKEQSFAGMAMAQTSLAHAIFYLDGTLAYINRQMRKTLKLNASEVNELDLLGLMKALKTDIFNDPNLAIKRVLQTGETYECDLDFAKGSKILNLTIDLIKTSDGNDSEIHESVVLTKPVCVVISVKDITAIKENEKLRSDMANLMSHELRTPITSIKGFAELLLLDDKIPEESREFLTIISNESQRLSNMLTTFLSVSKLEQSDKKEFHKTAVKVDSVVHEVVEQMQTVARKKRIRLVEDTKIALPPVAADKSLLTKAILQLIDNAIRYSPDKTSVMVSTMMEAEVLRVVVEDRGYGIPTDQLDKIWQKFYRVEREGIDKQEETTGLGLSFVKEIIEKHGGKVKVDSKVGFGSKFSLTLPRL